MKTFQPRYTKNRENPTVVTAKTDETTSLGGFVSFGSDPHGVFAKKAVLDVSGESANQTPPSPIPSIENNFENTLIPPLPKLTELVAPLPWQLKSLVRAATSGVLNIEVHGIRDMSRYVMAWGLDYFTTNDKDNALTRLWEVYRVWQPQKN